MDKKYLVFNNAMGNINQTNLVHYAPVRNAAGGDITKQHCATNVAFHLGNPDPTPDSLPSHPPPTDTAQERWTSPKQSQWGNSYYGRPLAGAPDPSPVQPVRNEYGQGQPAEHKPLHMPSSSRSDHYRNSPRTRRGTGRRCLQAAADEELGPYSDNDISATEQEAVGEETVGEEQELDNVEGQK